MLYRFGYLLARRSKLVLALAFVGLIAAAAVGAGAFGKLQAGGFEDPASDSHRAAQVVAEQFGSDPNLILIATPDDGNVDSEASKAAGAALTAELAAEPGVAVAASYWQQPIPQLRATDGSSAMILLVVAGDQGTMVTRGGEIADKYSGEHNGLTVSAGGPAGVFGDINTQVTKSLAIAESIAIPVTLILLLIVFGSVVAALLPLLIGTFAIIGTFALLSVLGSITDVSIFAINLTTALGLGLGIDYGLLIVARFREQLAKGEEVADAVAHTVATAGRTILFSAAAVAAALATLLVFPLYFLSSFGYAGVGVVVIAAVTALVITPAALAVLGHRIDKGKLPFAGTARGSASPFWGRLARTVFRHPVLTAVPVLAALLLAASPVLGIAFALPDEKVLPTSSPSRQVATTIDQQYPTQSTASILVVSPGPVGAPDATSYAIALSTVDGVTSVATSSATVTDGVAGPPDATAAALSADGYQRLKVVTDVPAGSDQALDLVRALRDVPNPNGFLIGGQDAALVDTLAAIGAPLPLALTLIVISTFVILFLFTGSVVQPIRALLINGLSLAATLGLMTWIFQDGHLIDVFGATIRPMDASMTVLLLCITFGLSMDYEVFLSSRITELHRAGADLQTAVTEGLARTGRIVSSAAALLAVSFFAFASSSVSMLQMFGLGAGLALLIDATLVRGVLVPAAMRALGPLNFWAPAPLRRLHEKIGLSEEPELESAGSR
jgi:RND superfamily putative drug exporter